MSQRTRKKNFNVLCASFVSFVFLFVSTRSTLAWDDGGHMLVAQIAYSQMSSVAKAKANALLKELPDVRQSTPNSKPRPYDFITAACWMDDFKSSSQFNGFRTWHYINPPPDGDVRKSQKPNALSQIELGASSLHEFQEETFENAVTLAVLIHLVGDIHQPLHATGQDLGGNTFPILGVPGIETNLRGDGKPVERDKPAIGTNAAVYQRLHAYWDCAYRYGFVESNDSEKSVTQLFRTGDSAHPDMKRIEQVAAELTAHYLTRDAKVLRENDAAQWAKESFNLANNLAFNTPRGKRPSNEYFQKSHDTGCAQIALAGYRLAQLLNTIFKS
jgi:hypothetical protein